MSDLDDKIKLAIRQEVEDRVEKREGIYWKFGGVLVVVVIFFYSILWKAQISEVRTEIAKQMALEKVMEARDRIFLIKAEAESQVSLLKTLSQAALTNTAELIIRLRDLKEQDNVILAQDFSRYFVSQIVTNLVGNNSILLEYEPIPETVTIGYTEISGSVPMPLLGMNLVNGRFVPPRTVVLDGNTAELFKALDASTQRLRVDYVRKSFKGL